ncbi:hypothetical protein B0H17DRAFT_1132064 [Mycena rosella]|uniref:Uncharacterized protein n=1 Tax=Mycena rosella TaxID=1033263 RepID=A0AAD7DLX3_MYCRO|nr:hypothetical protein B0H17DRAFT_1132064 [Mycena rosella]
MSRDSENVQTERGASAVEVPEAVGKLLPPFLLSMVFSLFLKMSRPGPPTFAGEISTCRGTYTRIESATKTRFFFYNTSPEQAEEHGRRLMDSANGTVYGGEVTTAGHIRRQGSETSTDYH